MKSGNLNFLETLLLTEITETTQINFCFYPLWDKVRRTNNLPAISHAIIYQPTKTPVSSGLSTPPTLVFRSQRMVPMLVVNCNALHSLHQEFLSSNNLITISVEYVTIETGYTPIWLTQLSQWNVMFILIPKYKPFQHFPTLWLSVRQWSTAKCSQLIHRRSQ